MDKVIKLATISALPPSSIKNILYGKSQNPKLLTILSSELTEDELLDVDEAVGGRIYERARAFTVGRSRDKNYRLRKAVRL